MTIPRAAGIFLLSCALAGGCVSRKHRAVSGGPADALGVRFWAPAETVTEGGVFRLAIESHHPVREVSARLQEKTIRFYPLDGEGRRLEALVGFEFGIEPGSRDIRAKVCVETAPPQSDRPATIECAEPSVTLAVKKGEFPSEKLKVPPRSVEPTAADLERIRKDNQRLAKVYASSVPERLWDPPVAMPVGNEVTSVYGSSRVYNGKIASTHLGTDFRAPTGTSVLAPVTGRVALARNLFFTGYTVILDHGFGFFTIYGHLSRLKTKEGEVARKGSLVGLSGATGRASGPHLHWGVRLHGLKVDPLAMVELLK